MLVVHLFVSYAHVNLCHFSLPPGVRGWLRLLLVALPGLFCLPLFCAYISKFSTYGVMLFFESVSFAVNNRKKEENRLKMNVTSYRKTY